MYNYNLKTDYVFGLLIGISIVLGMFYSFGLFLALFILMLRYKIDLNRTKILIVTSGMLMATFIVVIGYYEKNYNFVFLFFEILPYIVFMIFLLFTPSVDFLKGVYLAILILFFVDAAFNFSLLLTGHDLVGRNLSHRADDIVFSRLGGVFGHPYLSITLSFLTGILAMCFRDKKIIIIAFIMIFINGSLKGTMALCGLLYLVFFFKNKNNFSLSIIQPVVLIFSVVTLTILSLPFMSELSGNYFRVYSWSYAFTSYLNNLFLGGGPFNINPIESISTFALMDHGVAESRLLQTGLYFGSVPLFFQFLFLILLIKFCYEKNNTTDSWYYTQLSLASFLLFDVAVGTIFGSIISSCIIPLILTTKVETETETETETAN